MMTNLHQNQPPIFCYEIWECEGEVHGSIIDWKPWFVAQKGYDYGYEIRGKAAHFIVVTHDAFITKSEAIDFCRAVVEGKVRRMTVDLTPCQANRKK